MNEVKLPQLILALLVCLTIGVVSLKFVAIKAATIVENNLKKDYTPGPFQPGFDPDKKNPFSNAFSGK